MPRSGSTLQCEVCLKSFQQKSRLEQHQKTHSVPLVDKKSKIPKSPNSDKKPFECDICFKTFSHSQTLKEHHTIHTGERPHKCDICGKSFGHKSHVTRHKRIHTGEKPHKCLVCNKAFSQRDALKSHSNIHTREGSFECSICGAKFSREGYMAGHMRKCHLLGEPSQDGDIQEDSGSLTDESRSDVSMQSGQKSETSLLNISPVKPSYEYANSHESSQSATYAQSNITHETLYGCDVCEKTFGRKSHLHRHRKIHTGKRPYECDICHLVFTHKDLLRSHQIIHTGNVQSRSDIVTSGFRRSASVPVVNGYSYGEKPCVSEFVRENPPLGEYVNDDYNQNSGSSFESSPSDGSHLESDNGEMWATYRIVNSLHFQSKNKYSVETRVPTDGAVHSGNNNGVTPCGGLIDESMALSRGALEMFMGVSLSDVEAELGGTNHMDYHIPSRVSNAEKVMIGRSIESFVAYPADSSASHYEGSAPTYYGRSGVGGGSSSQTNSDPATMEPNKLLSIPGYVQLQPSVFSDQNNATTYSCSYCHLNFTSSGDMMQHISVHMS